jgi:hypothetical protein
LLAKKQRIPKKGEWEKQILPFHGKKHQPSRPIKCVAGCIIFITVCISRLVYIKTTEITYSGWLGVSRMFFQDHPMQSSADINNVGFPMVSSNLSGKPI